MKTFKLKRLYISSFFIITLFCNCGNTKITGNWVDKESNIILEIDKNELIFKLPESDSKRVLNYENVNNYLYFTNELELKDSIKVVQVSSDTLVLGLKEKGRVVNKTFTRK